MVWSGWDFHGVGQRAGDQRLTIEERVTGEFSKLTPEPIRPSQSGVGGDEDVHLEEEVGLMASLQFITDINHQGATKGLDRFHSS